MQICDQQAKIISREIGEKEFPEKVEYFDFLFDLTIQKLEEFESGKEAEFLKQMKENCMYGSK